MGEDERCRRWEVGRGWTDIGSVASEVRAGMSLFSDGGWEASFRVLWRFKLLFAQACDRQCAGERLSGGDKGWQ